MPKINQAKILILSTDGYERSELREPLEKLKAKGADVKIASIKTGTIKSWTNDNWGDSVKVDLLIKDTKIADYDALVLPGGVINPDILRTDTTAVNFIRDFVKTGRPVAAVCHGPLLLVEAGVIKGRDATSYKSAKTDLKNAGANWIDKEVVTDENLITSRSPADLPAFINKIVQMVEEGRSKTTKAA
jgi:protease I